LQVRISFLVSFLRGAPMGSITFVFIRARKVAVSSVVVNCVRMAKRAETLSSRHRRTA
jgi:hypothetical protein